MKDAHLRHVPGICCCGSSDGCPDWCCGLKPEVPVAPAPTASAREWLIKNYNQVKGIGGVVYSDFGQLIRTDALVELLEAYASSQSSKVEGVGQEAAEKFSWWWEMDAAEGDSDYKAKIAGIIDELIAGRLKP